MSEQHLGEQEIIRREKLETLREMGIDPFGKRLIERIVVKTSCQNLVIKQKKN